jgi:four helix bundle protein
MKQKLIRSYRDLIIWQKSVELVTHIYVITKNFPYKETYGLTLQIRKCAISIPSNIAEGYGRNSTQDYIRFLNISIGSLYELETQILIAFNLKYISIESLNKLNDNCKEIERMSCSLINKIKSKNITNE